MRDETIVQSPASWPRVADNGAELEWVELKPGVRILRRKRPEAKMQAPPANKMRRKSENK